MRVRRLDHTSLRIADVARSRQFYEALLGLETAERPELGFPGVWYDVAGAQIHLIQHGGMMDGIDPTAPHLALQVESLADVKRALTERGIEFLSFGDAQLWIRDPDGNVVELCERR
jgi:glyoxylase I family protein